eukprot:COSAG01_NODE_622_length_14779_cov_69.589305_1_plen_736_part_10
MSLHEYEPSGPEVNASAKSLADRVSLVAGWGRAVMVQDVQQLRHDLGDTNHSIIYTEFGYGLNHKGQCVLPQLLNGALHGAFHVSRILHAINTQGAFAAITLESFVGGRPEGYDPQAGGNRSDYWCGLAATTMDCPLDGATGSPRCRPNAPAGARVTGEAQIFAHLAAAAGMGGSEATALMHGVSVQGGPTLGFQILGGVQPCLQAAGFSGVTSQHEVSMASVAVLNICNQSIDTTVKMGVAITDGVLLTQASATFYSLLDGGTHGGWAPLPLASQIDTFPWTSGPLQPITDHAVRVEDDGSGDVGLTVPPLVFGIVKVKTDDGEGLRRWPLGATNCSAARPCIVDDHDCAGNDIFDLGRTKAYTFQECLALCSSTQGCTGFVHDRIPSEAKGQCKVTSLPPNEGCCLLKTACVNYSAKKGDTAVSIAPPPENLTDWCPAYHKIHSTAMCDPSGPIQTADGAWHIFDDCYWCTADTAPHFPCPWAHWVSTDLLRWRQVPFNVGGCSQPGCGNPFHSTGSLSYTGSDGGDMIIAMNGYLEGRAGLQATHTNDTKLETWPRARIVAPHPPSSKGGFRDPARAISIGDRWFVAVGSGTGTRAQVLFFEATNSSLSAFEAPRELYGTTHSFVSNNKIVMFECPDVFKLGQQHTVVLTSVEGNTQWMVGSTTSGQLSGGPTFVPNTGGYSDQGLDYYGAQQLCPPPSPARRQCSLFVSPSTPTTVAFALPAPPAFACVLVL